jgi:ABC-type enterochelin transport system substrate-binding protein
MFKVVVDRLHERYSERVEHLTETFATEEEARKRQSQINNKPFTHFMAYVHPVDK